MLTTTIETEDCAEIQLTEEDKDDIEQMNADLEEKFSETGEKSSQSSQEAVARW